MIDDDEDAPQGVVHVMEEELKNAPEPEPAEKTQGVIHLCEQQLENKDLGAAPETGPVEPLADEDDEDADPVAAKRKRRRS